MRSVFRIKPEDKDINENSFTIQKKVEYNELYKAWFMILPKRRHIGFLVDTSSSMINTYKSVVEMGTEEFLENQRDLDGDIFFYGYTFSNTVSVLFNGVDLKSDGKLDEIKQKFFEIKVSGCTAFYDAIFQIFKDISHKSRPGDEVVICCMTDGLDNMSVKTPDIIKQFIQNKKKLGWTLALFGTVEAQIFNNVSDLGLTRDCIMEIGDTQEESRNAYRNLSCGLNRVRNGQDTCLSFTPLERNQSCSRNQNHQTL